MSTLRARRFLARRQIVCGQATTDCPGTPVWHMPEMTTSPGNCAPLFLVKDVKFRQLNEFQCNTTIHSLKVSEVSACANSAFFSNSPLADRFTPTPPFSYLPLQVTMAARLQAPRPCEDPQSNIDEVQRFVLSQKR